MNARTGIVAALLLSAACTDGGRVPDGAYSPACIAFEGDTLELDGGRFVWDRFTDVIDIGPDGEPVDAFPDFPQTGTFRVDGDRLELTADDGSRLDDWYVVAADDALRLLSADQYSAVGAGGDVPACALVAKPVEN